MTLVGSTAWKDVAAAPAAPAAVGLAPRAARRGVIVGLGAFGALLIALGVALTLTSDHADAPVATAVTGALLMASWIGTGLLAWWRLSPEAAADRLTSIEAAAESALAGYEQEREPP